MLIPFPIVSFPIVPFSFPFSIVRRLFLLSVLSSLLCGFVGGIGAPLTATTPVQPLPVLLDFEQVPALFRHSYAPLEWKKQYAGWDLETATTEARAQLFADGLPGVERYRQTLRHFLASLHDYHVGVLFASTEEATLPFRVMEAEGKYWISWMNRDHLPKTCFPFKVGDELVLFDGKPVQECIDEILAECYAGGTSQTERLLAQKRLVCRTAMHGDTVPQGLISISVASARTGKIKEYQLAWEYEENALPPLHAVKESHEKTAHGKTHGKKGKKCSLFDLSMWMAHVPCSRLENSLHDIRYDPSAMARRESFFPPLADPEFYGQDEDADEEFPFYAYTFEHPQTGKTIGFVRIPHYVGGEEEVQAFGELIEHFEQTTSALVIDQVNNPGGEAYYLYALAAFLSPEPLNTPRHQFTLSHDLIIDVDQFYQQLKDIYSTEFLESWLKALSDNFAYHPITYQTNLMLRNHCYVLLETWRHGKTLTPPVHLGGMDQVFPHPEFLSYTKPILLLINGQDFSGGDFLAAILKDSKLKGKPRAVLFGERTAGAGGIVRAYQFPNRYGVYSISYTASIACRPGLPLDTGRIEDLGVTPDIPYKMTPEDIRHKWKGYTQAILDALVPMTESKSAS